MAGRTQNLRTIRALVTTPLGTLASAPQSTTVDVGRTVVLREVRVRVPSGHAGLTGLRLDHNGQTVLPYSNTANWLVGDDQDWLFDMDDIEVDTPVTVVTYNTDRYAHGHELHFTVADINVGARAGVPLVVL